MPNQIALFKKYIDLLDEVYKVSGLTAVLDSDASLMTAGANANEIVIPKLSMVGLADYKRNDGYVKGDVDFTFETVKFNYDRGRSFMIDAMDNEETVSLAFGKLSSTFIREKVVPEMDAFRFAEYAGLEDISKVDAGATLADGAAVITALRAATNKMDEDEVPYENRLLFITPTLDGMIQDLDTTKSKEVISRFSQKILVPQTRFYTAVELIDGTTDATKMGGYKKADGAAEINFMVIHKPALLQYTKHTVSKVTAPDDNKDADAWEFAYRAYGLADAYENKRAGIYLHHKATA
ncbi:hypothetical protein [Christensenella intestinihominis]|uniref:hypothetical protein n=1 Tax=Christensenella intestinihominis TaxID=1851429 RepID=UPI00082EE746|nr:hypothetical protein [Christensenella intestinihominis]